MQSKQLFPQKKSVILRRKNKDPFITFPRYLRSGRLLFGPEIFLKSLHLHRKFYIAACKTPRFFIFDFYFLHQEAPVLYKKAAFFKRNNSP